MTEKTPTGIYFDVKKKPFDIQIDNNKKEHKVYKNMKYTDKQNYRIYKTQIEPQLFNRIVVDDNNPTDEVKIQKLLGTYKEPQLDQYQQELKDKNANVFTAPSAPVPNFSGVDAISDISIDDTEELLGMITTPARDRSWLSVYDRTSTKTPPQQTYLDMFQNFLGFENKKTPIPSEASEASTLGGKSSGVVTFKQQSRPDIQGRQLFLDTPQPNPQGLQLYREKPKQKKEEITDEEIQILLGN